MECCQGIELDAFFRQKYFPKSDGTAFCLQARGPRVARPALVGRVGGGPTAGGLGRFSISADGPRQGAEAGVTVPGVLPTHRRRGVPRGK
jgi:hypothetical protein